MQTKLSGEGHTFGVLCWLLASCAGGGGAEYAAMRSEYAALAARLDVGRQPDAPLAAGPLERGALIRAVLDRNPSAAAALETWRAVLARYRQAGSLEDPTLKLMAAPLSFGAAHAPAGYEVGISQRIPLGGKLAAEQSLAVAETEAAASDVATVRLELARAASQLYDDYVVATRSARINAEHAEFLGTLQQSAAAMYESGRGTAQDSLALEAELAQLEYANISVDTERKVIVAQLNTLLHRAPEAALPAPPSEVSAEPARDVADEEAVRARPDLRAAQAQVRVARARKRLADASAVPDLMLMTSYNSMWEMPEHRWMAGIELDLPLPRERRNGAVEEAEAMQAAAEREVQRVTDAARAELAVARLRVQESQQGLALYDLRLIPLARDRVAAARAAFVASSSELTAVIAAARELRELELRREGLLAESNRRIADLDRARGVVPGAVAPEAQP